MKRLLALMLVGCSIRVYDSGNDPTASAGTVPTPGGGPVTDCPSTIDPWRELLVVDPSVLGDARARNDDADGAWSFRARLDEIAGASTAGDAALAWLNEWSDTTTVGPDDAPVTPRPAVESVLVDPWRAASAAGCNAAGLDPARAPFRLIAIVNRIDLRDDPAACVGGGGELRFVYTAVDLGTAGALPMTVIVEIPYPKTRSAHDWAAAWHALGALPFGAEYDDALEALTRSVTDVVDARTIRVRTNESALGSGWELREFAASGAGALEQVTIDSTPRADLDGSSTLASWVSDNASVVATGAWVLPSAMRAGAAPIPSAGFRWHVTGAPPDLATTFSAGTCNGCHGGETSALPFQHLSAGGGYYGGDGATRVSPYLVSELGRRSQSMQNALCSSCDGGSASPYGAEPGSPSCSK
jgi:hypothetical protein